MAISYPSHWKEPFYSQGPKYAKIKEIIDDVNLSLKTTGGTMTGDLVMGNNNITQINQAIIADPSSVDSLIEGFLLYSSSISGSYARLNFVDTSTIVEFLTDHNAADVLFKLRNKDGTYKFNFETDGTITSGGAISGSFAADDSTYTGLVTNDSGVLKYRTLAQIKSDLALTISDISNLQTQLDSKIGGSTFYMWHNIDNLGLQSDTELGLEKMYGRFQIIAANATHGDTYYFSGAVPMFPGWKAEIVAINVLSYNGTNLYWSTLNAYMEYFNETIPIRSAGLLCGPITNPFGTSAGYGHYENTSLNSVEVYTPDDDNTASSGSFILALTLYKGSASGTIVLYQPRIKIKFTKL